MHTVESYHLTPEGDGITENGSPEFLLWRAVGPGGKRMENLKVSQFASTTMVNCVLRQPVQTEMGLDTFKNGQSNAFKQKLVRQGKDAELLERSVCTYLSLWFIVMATMQLVTG